MIRIPWFPHATPFRQRPERLLEKQSSDYTAALGILSRNREQYGDITFSLTRLAGFTCHPNCVQMGAHGG